MRAARSSAARPPASVQALAGPRVELTGFVPDLRPHLAEAAAVVVPLRLGGGTRLKIVEAMAMGKAIVSTTLGAEGINAVPGREILIEDDPAAFADAVSRLLAEPGLATRIGQSAQAAGGGALRLERRGPGAGRLLSPHPRDEKPARLRGAGFADANAPRPARALTSQSASGGPSQLAVRLPLSAQELRRSASRTRAAEPRAVPAKPSGGADAPERSGLAPSLERPSSENRFSKYS